MADAIDTSEELEAVYQRGLAFYRAGDFASAEDTFRRMMSLAVNDRARYASATYSLAMSLIQLGQTAEARKRLEAALTVNPKLHRARDFLDRLNRKIVLPTPSTRRTGPPAVPGSSTGQARPSPASPPGIPGITKDQAPSGSSDLGNLETLIETTNLTSGKSGG